MKLCPSHQKKLAGVEKNGTPRKRLAVETQSLFLCRCFSDRESEAENDDREAAERRKIRWSRKRRESEKKSGREQG